MSEQRFRIEVALDYQFAHRCTVLLGIEAAHTDDQRISDEALILADVLMPPAPASVAQTRWRWVEATAGPLSIRYEAAATVARDMADWSAMPATPLARLPQDVARWLMPSRYCQPEKFLGVIADEFGLMDGQVADGERIAAMAQWVRRHLRYESVSDSGTTAIDTYVARRGVCRDYAHLVIALARAAGVPARFVSAYGADVDPPDFHAVAELWIGGAWHLIDATGMAEPADLIRIATAADAAGAAFMSIFGRGHPVDQQIRVHRIS